MPLIPITIRESASSYLGHLIRTDFLSLQFRFLIMLNLVCLNNTVALSLTIFFTSIPPGFGTNVMFSHEPSLKGKLLKPPKKTSGQIHFSLPTINVGSRKLAGTASIS